jgi:hypothetical protein
MERLIMNEFEYEAYVPGTSVWAQISKVGGGTPPKQYVGTWEYTLRNTTRDGKILMQGADLNIPLLVTHAVAAKTAFEFLAASLEDAPEPQSGYTPCACRDCMDTTVSSDMTKPELCTLCTDADCALDDTECQRDDAYGSGECEDSCGLHVDHDDPCAEG